MSRILKLLFPTKEQKLYLAIDAGKLGMVNQALAKKPNVKAKEYFTFCPDVGKWGRYLFANRSAINSYLSGSNIIDRGGVKYQTFFLTPVEFAVKVRSLLEAREGIVQALVAYGYPPHECNFATVDPIYRCSLVCTLCGGRKRIHEYESLCRCEDGAKVCRHCGEFVSSSEFVIYDFKSSYYPYGSGYIEVCVECFNVVRHSSLAGISRDQVQAFKWIAENDCRMLDTSTGKTYEVHAGVNSKSEYDTDYNRTIEFVRCTRCGKDFSPDYAHSRCKGFADQRRHERLRERDKQKFDEEIRELVRKGKAVLAMRKYQEKTGASAIKAEEYVKSIK